MPPNKKKRKRNQLSYKISFLCCAAPHCCMWSMSSTYHRTFWLELLFIVFESVVTCECSQCEMASGSQISIITLLTINTSVLLLIPTLEELTMPLINWRRLIFLYLDHLNRTLTQQTTAGSFQMPLTLCVSLLTFLLNLHYSDNPTLLTIKAEMSNKLPQSSNFHSLKAAFIL